MSSLGSYIFLSHVLKNNKPAMRGEYPLLQPFEDCPKQIRDILSDSESFLNFSFRLGESAKFFMNKQGSSSTNNDPLYIVLKSGGNQPRQGFFLKLDNDIIDKSNAYYLEIDSDANIFEEIFAHENAHLIDKYLMGNLLDNRKNRYIHAVSAITDYVTAFSEGWGGLFELRSIERSKNPYLKRKFSLDQEHSVDSYLIHFEDALSNNHKVKRDYLIRQNLFAFKKNNIRADGNIPTFVFNATNVNVQIGELKNAQQILSSEGVISFFFHSITSDERLQRSYRSDSFYKEFGRDRNDVSPEENVFLKIMYVKYQMVLHSGEDSCSNILVDFVNKYGEAFREERKRIFEHFYIATCFTTIWSDAASIYRNVYFSSHLALSRPERAESTYSSLKEKIRELFDSIGPESFLVTDNIGTELWITNTEFDLPYFWCRNFWNRKKKLQINLNTAEEYELMTIPSVNSAQAQELIKYREEVKYFGCIQDVEATGILSDSQLKKLRQMVD